MKDSKLSQAAHAKSRARVLLISGWLAGVLILASGCSSSANTEPEPTTLQYQEVAPDLGESWSEAFTLLDRYARQQIDDWALPGMALSLTDADRLLGVWTYGFANLDARSPVRPDTLFLMGSIGKSFTAIALLQEHERGTIDLHAPVHTYLPWFEVPSDRPPITVHDLLTHTAGIIGGSDLAPHGYYEAWALRHSRLATGPGGQRFHYSNVGYKTLGLVLEAVRGKSLGETLESGILEPLGMTASHGSITAETRKLSAVAYRPLYDDRPNLPGAAPLVPAGWHEYGAGDGSVTSTPADMAAYVRMLLNGGRGPQGRILSEESFGLLTSRFSGRADNLDYGYGLGIGVADGRGLLSHGGGHLSFVTSMIADPDAGVGAAVMMNGSGPAGAVARFALDLAVAVRSGEELPALPPAQDRERIADAQEYTGTYRSDSRQIAVVEDSGRLFLEVGAGPGSDPATQRIRLLSLRDDAFVVDHPELARFPLVVGRQDGAVVEAFHGAEWFRHERYDGPESFELPESWRSYEGHYRSHNPWFGNFRVLARKGRLYLVYAGGGASQLFPLEGGVFAVGNENAAERIRFSALAAGRTLVARYSGGDYYRAFSP